MLKIVSLLAAIVYTIALTVVSLIHLKDVPDIGVSHGDKIFHFFAYALLCLLWFLVFYLKFNMPLTKALRVAVLSAIIFGILIEVLQGTLTTKRSLDVYDAIANTLGALLTSVIILLKRKKDVKN